MARLHCAKRFVAPLLLGLTFGGCGRTGGDSHDSASRYVVTASPIGVGVGSGLCVAIDPNDPKRVVVATREGLLEPINGPDGLPC